MTRVEYQATWFDSSTDSLPYLRESRSAGGGRNILFTVLLVIIITSIKYIEVEYQPTPYL